MKQPPAPLAWPPVVTLEAARRQHTEALLAFDLALQRRATPEEVMAAFHAASQAGEYEAHIQQEQPGWN
jgi:hypothetical protein